MRRLLAVLVVAAGMGLISASPARADLLERDRKSVV